ncbi:hypothetical protein SEA_STORMINNORM_38 [Gordonia Phage StorminNorm]|uniref:Uncharacterized protein n=2 Tax=Kroosvirus TaxID=2948789 RepID=A0A515MKZ9_9CAUD|nr:hypothetical protein J1761_gp39 [Gordonia phage Kroos]YP_010002087.1 hypothetical protein J1767_gp38 [Gordonia phage Tangerine]URP21106.1 hypothetical protein SEA_FLATWOODS_39 [Gordonia phage Flatwoods]UTN91692.1 hypothetical protein SEA_STORMINNORM_38 [Gordonia Phage StorminNorm]AYR03018.1 hypothetical protein SEA_KROOS_39 [Gordonia phage Kroos]QDM57337.1 hypothetical protein SEA_TANGERINE_38 [Gordonia phage Tangerine]
MIVGRLYIEVPADDFADTDVRVADMVVDVAVDDFADSDVRVSSMMVDVPGDAFGPSIAEQLYPALTLFPADDLYPTGPPD